MKRSTFAIIGGLALILIGAVFVYAPHMAPVATPIPAETPHVATSTIEEHTDAYDIDAQYPQFGIPAVDAQITADVQGAIDELRAAPPVPHDISVAQNSFTGRFEDVYIGPDYVSASLILSQYTGGAHPMTVVSGRAYDRATGKRLELADVLVLTGKTVADISASSTAVFAKQFGDAFFSEGVDTNPENYSSFVVSKDAVTFIFQQYQVAPYVYGPQRFSVPRVK